MARCLVRGTDFQLIMIVHGNMGEGWWYLYIDGVCTVNSNLNGICPHSGSNCTIHWAKLNPKAKNNDPKTSEMKIRPADFSKSILLSEPAIFLREDFLCRETIVCMK